MTYSRGLIGLHWLVWEGVIREVKENSRITLEILKTVVAIMKLFLILAVETEADTPPHTCK